MTSAHEEIKRLINGPDTIAFPEGFDTETISVRCPGNAKDVLANCKQVLEIVLGTKGEWPDAEKWRSLLPSWFVEASGKERTKEESEIWRKQFLSLPQSEQVEALQQERWSVNAWTYWFMPDHDNRQWKWWNASVVSNELFWVELEVTDWPIALGALEWLLRASGAQKIEIE